MCIREEKDTEYIAGLFVCPVVQRIAQSPQLCRSLLSNAKQEINVARCMCLCDPLCVYGRLQTPLAASVSLLEVCVFVCERGRCIYPQAKGKPMPGKAGQ